MHGNLDGHVRRAPLAHVGERWMRSCLASFGLPFASTELIYDTSSSPHTHYLKLVCSNHPCGRTDVTSYEALEVGAGVLPGGNPHGMVETQHNELEEIPMPRLCSRRIANARARGLTIGAAGAAAAAAEASSLTMTSKSQAAGSPFLPTGGGLGALADSQRSA